MSSVPQIIRRRRHRRQQAKPGPVLYGGISAVVIVLAVIVLGIGGALAAGVFAYLDVADVIPVSPQDVRLAVAGEQPTVLLDRDARRVLYRVTDPLNGETPWIALDDLPPYVWQATIAIEDAAFFDRPGFSLPELMQALGDTLISGEMRLNDPILLYLTQHVLVPLNEMPLDDANRTLTDTILIMELRRRFTREELLGWYLNTALYGNGAYGIEAAARLYLGKSAADLTLGEAALLAGIPAFPARNPFDQPDQAHQRQEVVLDAMTAYAMIGPDEAEAASVRLDVTRPLAPTDAVAPHFALLARRQAESVLNEAGYDGPRLVAGGGLRITTSLDLDLQYQAECVLRTQITRLGGVDPSFVYATAIGEPCTAADWLPPLEAADVGVPHDVSNGAVVVVRPETGEVLAYVGSVDYWNEAIGGHIDSVERGYQPGSMIRPYIYLTAFAQGYTPATMTLDVPLSYSQPSGGTYEARNLDGHYRGPISLREAMLYNATPPAAQVMNWVSVPDVVRTAHRMGLNTLLDGPSSYDLSLVEQGGDVSLLDLTFSFGVFANEGHMVGVPVPRVREQPGFRVLDPVAVLRIEDEEGNVLWPYEPQTRDTLDPALAYLVNNVLSDVELRAEELGVENVYTIGRPAAAYGGGSSDGRDLWTVGYTPQLSAGVWMGNVDRTPTARLDAQNGPGAVWHAVMRYVHERDNLPPADWARPPDIVEVPVCAVSGLLPTEYCPVITEVFYQGTQPVEQDHYYQMVEVNRQNGRRATASTPRDLVEQRVYFNYPEEAREWAAAQGLPLPPTEYDSVGPPAVFGPVAVLSPEPLDYVSGVIDVRGNATLPGFQYYQLAYGQGLNPDEWIQIGDRVFTPARGALLGRWDTTGLEGLYSLRLTVVTAEQAVEESVIQVTVDNTPPQVSISTPEEGEEVFVTGTNPVLNAGVTYSDNVGVTQVVYYFDGEAITTVIEAPFAAPIVLESLGQHSIWAEAFDAAGNSTLSERVTFTVRRGS